MNACVTSYIRTLPLALLLSCAVMAQSVGPDASSQSAPKGETTVGARASDPASIASITLIAEKAREAGELPGIVVAIVPREGEPILAAAGARAATEDAAITVDDAMHLGSCTKAFTATLAAALVADGVIAWRTTIGELLSIDAPDLHEAWRAVTLEDLLRHRGGAPSNPPPAIWTAAFSCELPPIECRAQFVRGLLAMKPGERGKHAYSNQGYAIAGRMLEIASLRGEKDADGKPTASVAYETLLTDRVLLPLGITRACFGPPLRTNPSSPKGHTEAGVVRDIDNPNAIAPAGTLAMPLGDWAKFVAFHLGAEPPKPLVGAARELQTLHRKHQEAPFEALGWRTAERPWGGAVLMHAGSNTLWYCVAWLSPEKGFAVLAATNQGGDAAAKACDEACAALIQHFQE
ncbi:MAG: serine hydrolase [Limnohabitans sp.]|nr:serine hydrolase [Limnohabitans sp.]